MKNLKSFPFERNRYFYGKLLSVEDFETEQKYFNDKRRTINRFLFGSGVVCGLGVVEVDDESISVERGWRWILPAGKLCWMSRRCARLRSWMDMETGRRKDSIISAWNIRKRRRS